jgi:hypothetical protein
MTGDSEKPKLVTEVTRQGGKPSLLKEFIRVYVHLFWTWMGFDTLADDFESHNTTVKKARALAFLVVLGVLTGVTGFLLKGCSDSGTISSLVQNGQSNGVVMLSYQVENTHLNRRVSDDQSALAELKRQRDEANNALAPWVQLANSHFTNTPVTKRLDSLYEIVKANAEAFTSILQAMTIDRPTFRLTLNEEPLSSISEDVSAPYRIMAIPEPRELRLRVENVGKVTAEHLTISVLCPVNMTNVNGTGWEAQAAGKWQGNIGGQEVHLNDLSHWVVVADKSIANNSLFIAPRFIISTNVMGQATIMLVFVHADRSAKQDYGAVLVFSKIK